MTFEACVSEERNTSVLVVILAGILEQFTSYDIDMENTVPFKGLILLTSSLFSFHFPLGFGIYTKDQIPEALTLLVPSDAVSQPVVAVP